jgi:hypothetical protein
MKELVAATMIVLLAALAAQLLASERRGARAVLPVATACAALLSILTVGGVAWLAALLVPALALGVWMLGARRVAPLAGIVAGLVALLSIPALLTASDFIDHVRASDVLTSGAELGNLIRPLRRAQLFGIWPAGDFRLDPGHKALTYVLVGVVAAAAVAGVVHAVAVRAWGLVLCVAAAVLGYLTISHDGSPWVDAKALATASPALVVAALCGVAWSFDRRRPGEAAVGAAAGAAIALGVLWSNALAYRDAWLAPKAQLVELGAIGKRFAGEGPTLMTEYQTYGTRHFLRRMDTEGAGERRYRLIPLRNGQAVEKGGYADVDDFQLDGLLVYRTLVLLRSPYASRPPSDYSEVWSGKWYGVWQQSPIAPRILEHLSLGDDTHPAATPPCAEILRLAKSAARSDGRLAAVHRGNPITADLSQVAHPAGWATLAGSPGDVFPTGDGALETVVMVPAPGPYSIWLGGSFRREVTILVDGRPVGTARHQIDRPGAYTPFGTVRLSAGRHRVRLEYGGSALRPGAGGTPFAMGPLVLGRSTADLPVVYVDSAAASSLCGKSLDWVEALSP